MNLNWQNKLSLVGSLAASGSEGLAIEGSNRYEPLRATRTREVSHRAISWLALTGREFEQKENDDFKYRVCDAFLVEHEYIKD